MPERVAPNQVRTKTAPRPRAAEKSQPVVKRLFSAALGSVDEQRSFHGDELPVGRGVDPAVGLSLADDEVGSRTHLVLHREEDAVRLRDGGSKNGTFVNGKRQDECILQDGDVIRAGSSLLLFRLEPGVTPDAPDGAEPVHRLLLGRSPAIAETRYRLALAAKQSESVLLLGETGTGKERAARALHELSGRKGPFIPFNTPQLTKELAASELFGHEKGVFTGAHQRRSGLFEEAHTGTIFFDEIGDLALDLQSLLLRVLEEKVIRPVGGQDRQVDVRVVAATNRDLELAIAAGQFRADLRARLARIVVTLPRLRERKEDILPLFLHYLGEQRRLTADLGEALMLYDWPENVRELVNLTTHVRTFAGKDEVVDFRHVEPRISFPEEPTRPPATDAALTTESVEPRVLRPRTVYDQELVQRLLRKHRGILTRVADAIGVSRRQLTRKLQQWNLDPESFRGKSP